MGGGLISLAVLAEFVSQHPWTPGTCIHMPMPYTDIHTHLHITTKLIRVGGQVVRDRVSLQSPSCLGICSVDQVSLKLKDPPSSAS